MKKRVTRVSAQHITMVYHIMIMSMSDLINKNKLQTKCTNELFHSFYLSPSVSYHSLLNMKFIYFSIIYSTNFLLLVFTVERRSNQVRKQDFSCILNHKYLNRNQKQRKCFSSILSFFYFYSVVLSFACRRNLRVYPSFISPAWIIQFFFFIFKPLLRHIHM